MSYHEGSNWQANKEDKKEPLYTDEKLKFLLGKDKPFFMDTLRDLIHQYDKEEISLSKFLEELNLKALEWHTKRSLSLPKGEWISVEDRLPEHGELAAYEYDHGDWKSYGAGAWSDEDEKYYKLNNVVRWIPLTLPIKEIEGK